MQYTLEIAFSIPEIGAASGIYLSDGRVFLVSDNGSHLFVYNVEQKVLEKIIIFEFQLPGQIPKHLKADFEALAYHDNKLYVFGSGSTAKRNLVVVVDINSAKVISSANLENLYAQMQLYAEISDADFNIEGAAYDGEKWYFFQRGNGPKGHNGIYTITGAIFEAEPIISYKEYRLPSIGGIPATFTDAILVDGHLFFVACAEDSNSVYDDGEILGSLIGSIDPVTMNLEFTQLISNSHKFEGITLFTKSETQIEFLLCEDNDNEILESNIYKLSIELGAS